jgi:type IV secretory pathway VirB10-like protein
MARASKLKVYRTPAGFYDVYVAAPSQKAALEAWGSDHDLFARGIAELVTDPALTAEPLATPGVVVRHSRGTAAEQIAALPPQTAPAKSPKKAAAPPPKPSSADVDAAETALVEAKQVETAKLKDLTDREAKLARERRALERDQRTLVQQAEQALDDERRAYEAALRGWKRARSVS